MAKYCKNTGSYQKLHLYTACKYFKGTANNSVVPWKYIINYIWYRLRRTAATLSHKIINWISLRLWLLIRQNVTFEDVTLGSGKLWLAFLTSHLLTFHRPNKNRFIDNTTVRLLDNESKDESQAQLDKTLNTPPPLLHHYNLLNHTKTNWLQDWLWYHALIHFFHFLCFSSDTKNDDKVNVPVHIILGLWLE